jgi:large subunit ribosomal protein L13
MGKVEGKTKRSQKTYMQKPAEVTREWVIIDASETTLGRAATVIARQLSGRYKVEFTRNVDQGNNVIVVNAGKIEVTGKKKAQKEYFHYSGYPGGMRRRTLGEQLTIDPRKVIWDTVYGMMPKNKLRNVQLTRLRIYNDENHKHEAQTPKKVEVK